MHLLRLLPLLVLSAVALVACDSGESASPDASPTPTATPVATAEPTDTPTEGERPDGDDFASPPAGAIVIDGVEYPLGLGGYCWGAGEGGPPAMCADPIGTITAFPYAEAAPGATVSIAGHLADFEDVVIRLAQFGLAPAEPVASDADWEAWHPQFDGDSELASNGRSVELPAGLEPGRYLLELYIEQTTNGNSAIYAAIVDVQ